MCLHGTNGSTYACPAWSVGGRYRFVELVLCEATVMFVPEVNYLNVWTFPQLVQLRGSGRDTD
ncbi:hypothetical protein BO226_08795 [Rhodococcus sp. 2G]|nr:hypothetical protein BO226_08795 [Rhodococcus sp. 2G]